MIRRDMPEVLDIEGECFGMHAWTEEEFISCLRQRNCIGMVAEDGKDGAICGYMIYELHKTRLHLLTFAVGWQWQRKGVGQTMMDKLKGKLHDQCRKKITAEIRETNVDAQKFFASQGFKATNILKDYYWNAPVPCDEDAYVFEHRITAQRMQERT
jgi:ribosomal-protein-alanine N-acetyltransferase